MGKQGPELGGALAKWHSESLTEQVIVLLVWALFLMLAVYLFIFKDFIYLFLERKRRRKRERSINVWLPLAHPLLGTWPATRACALTGN